MSRDPGFYLVEGVLVASECDALCAALEGRPRSRAGARHLMSIPEVATLASSERLRELARTVIGGSPVPYRATLFDKSRGANWLVVWHQDTALPLKQRADVPGWGPWSTKQGIVYAHAPASALETVVALRVHLDHSTKENGPLRVVPGSHLHGVLSDQGVDRVVQEGPIVECLTPRGGVLAMRPLLVHSSSKVRGSARRRVLHIEYSNQRTFGPGLSLDVA